MMQTVKLSRLRLSDINVRKSAELSIDQLAADIAARGVLQNLLVTPMAKPRGHFAVFDGGRRFRALSLLAETGAITGDDYDVPVLVLKGDDATLSETSLAANFQQLRLTPAEECRAFQHFLGADGDIDAVAKRFGITRRFVEGRLRLAALADPIFDALEAGAITLDVAKAYASTENRDKQLLIWDAYSGHSYINADTIRRAIANETLQATDPVAVLVGEARYRDAGGIIDADLFSEAGDRWINPEIAQRLAAELMEAEAKRLTDDTGLAWIRPIASSYTYDAARDLYPVPLEQVPLDETQQARLDTIELRMNELSDELDDENLPADAGATLEAEYQSLEAERDAIVDRPRLLPDALRPLVGAFLVLTHKGEMTLDTRFYSEVPLERASGGDNGDDDGAPLLPRPDSVAPGGKPLSARLADELAMQSRDVLAAALIAQPALALDYALFALADGQRSYAHDRGTTIAARAPADPVFGSAPPSRAREYLAETRDGLDSSWCEQADAVERFDAFRALDDEAKGAWLASVVAASLEARSGGSRGRAPILDRLADLLELNPADWWRPTSENFFDRVPKAALLTLLGEVGGPAFAARYTNAKKGELSESCDKLFAGEAIVEAEVKERALAWVPAAMRFGAAPPDADGDPSEDTTSEPSGSESADNADGLGTDDEAADTATLAA